MPVGGLKSIGNRGRGTIGACRKPKKRREEIMKQSASSKRYARIGLAVAIGAICLGTAGVAAAQSSNSIYGNFRWSINSVDSDEIKADTAMGVSKVAGIDSTIRADSNTSRLGLRGETKGDSLTAFYHVEGGLQNDDGGNGFTSRFFYAGLKGDFGNVTVGRHSPAYKTAGGAVNPFGDMSTAGFNGAYSPSGAAYGLSNMTNGFANNTLAYTSPKIAGGLVLNAGVYFDDSEEDDHDYAVGAAFAEGPLTVGIQYYQTGDSGNAWTNAQGTTRPNPTAAELVAGAQPVDRGQKAYRVHGSYSTGPIKLGLSAEMQESDEPRAFTNAKGQTMVYDDVKYYFLSGTYSISKETRASASFGMVDNGPHEGIGFNLGVFHDIVPNTTVYALYSNADLDERDSTSVVSLGLIYNFNMSL
jgi:hypothetical protein